MKKITSEKGYALLVTLLTFTVLMIIGISIWGMIINNSKQIHKTEKDIQSTDLAEMGFVYNYTVINDTFLSLTDELKASIIEKINHDKSQVPPISQDYTKIAIKELFNGLTDTLRTTSMLKQEEIVSLNGNNKYTILPTQNSDYPAGQYVESKLINNITFLLDETNYKITILFNSSGSTGDVNTKKTLKLNFDIKLKPITISDGSTGDPIQNPPDLDFVITKPDISGLNPCNSLASTFTGHGCATLGDQTFSSNKIDITGTNMYIDGDAEFIDNSKITINNNSKVYITGDSSFGTKIDEISSSYVRVDGTATITDLETITNSVLEVGKLTDGTDNGTNLGTISNSTIRVAGDADLHNINMLFSNSKLL
ncbi:MAG TPA: hypothetical protein VEV44_12765, partial [Pseudoneobacillus sp.]|nr:hypothetical protein [Pseudoneobacillus sp.]